MYRNIICCLFFFLASAFSLPAQVVGEVSEPVFQELVDKLEYEKTKNRWKLKERFVPKPLEEEESKKMRRSSPLASGLFSILAYAAIFALVGFIIYLIFSQVVLDKKLDPVFDEIDEIEDIEDIDAEADYSVAVAAGNYRLALRMQFIKFLQLLSKKEKILWEREKTNRDYHRELTGSDLKRNFRELASIYERVWYGEEALDPVKFRSYDQRFITYHNRWR